VGALLLRAERDTGRAMSQENVEIVRRWFESFTAGVQIDAHLREFWDEEVDYYPVRKVPEAQPCHGLEEVSDFFARWLEPWSRLDFVIRELVDVGDERVLAHVNLRGEGRRSGMSLAGDLYYGYWLRHGRFLRVEDHLTLSGALHALGLEGETLEAVGLRQ
jgi:ketosteroid isomerase-like protein